MHPQEEGPAAALAPAQGLSPEQASQWLQQHGPRCWQTADVAGLRLACQAVPDAALAQWPDVARWRALAAVLSEQADALGCLDCAHTGHLALGDATQAGLDAHMALVLCLLDIGAMDAVHTWVQRSLRSPEPPAHDPALWWWHAGRAARLVLDPAHAPGLSLVWLQQALAPLAGRLAAHEKLVVAQVLVNACFARQQFEQFDLIAANVMAPGTFDAVPPLLQSRFLHTLGFALYQVGRHDAAHASWQQGLAVAQTHGLAQVRWMLSLALLRLALDQGQLDEAARLEALVLPHWGAGRTTQLMELQQMRGRLLLLQNRPAQAQALVAEALALGAQAGLSAAELASCRTDEAQVLVGLGQAAAAQALLADLAQAASGRDATVYRCLGGLLAAWHGPAGDGVVSSEQRSAALEQALRDAQAIRYTMFFRLLPVLAGQLCALALELGLHTAFVLEVVRTRRLPAPPGAGPAWPWPVHLRMLGGFELRLQGQLQARPAKAQAKPLELLRLLACESDLSMSMRRAADALWPDAEGAAAHKSLEVTVQRLRRLLGDDSLLRVHEATLSLDATRVSSDLQQRRALGQTLQALAMQPPARDDEAALATLWQAVDGLRRWLALGGGPRAELLPGAAETSWLMARRGDVTHDSRRTRSAAQALFDRTSERATARGGATPEHHALATALAQGLAAW